MRHIIFALSLIFYISAAVITYLAINLPSKTPEAYDEDFTNTQNHAESSRIEPPELNELMDRFAKEQAHNREIVKELEATITQLEEKLLETHKNTVVEEENSSGTRRDQIQQQGKIVAVIRGDLFSSGKDLMSSDLRTAVKNIAQKIKPFPEHTIMIEGHTDNIPISSSKKKRYKDNYELSFVRAKAVALLLKEYGAPKDHISIIGYGDTRPAAPNITSQGRAKNRRVEIRLIPPLEAR